MFNLKAILLLFFLIRCHIITALIDLNYCSEGLNTVNKIYKKSDKFTFDVYSEKFYHVRLNDNKSLACCAPAGSNIEWTLNGKSLDKTNSTFRVVKEDHRYIQTSRITNYDIYSLQEKFFQCIVSNNHFPGKQLTHVFTIYKSDGTMPSINPVKHDLIPILPGVKTKLRCSLFLGYDSRLEQLVSTNWQSNVTKHFNETYLNSKDVKKDYIYRAGGELIYITTIDIEVDTHIWYQTFVFRCKFIIKGKENKYENEISVYPHENPLEDLKSKHTLTIMSILSVVVVITVAGLIMLHFQIEIRLIIKDKFGKLETSDGKHTDAFVCYNFNNDSYCAHTLFVNKNLVPHLEDTLGYSCYDFIRDTKVGAYIPKTVLEQIQKCRRLILILCDDLIEDSLCHLVCRDTINEAMQRNLPIICILPKPSKGKAISNKKKLSSSIKTVLNVAHKVTWPGQDASPRQCSKFWNTLRLRLPPRRQFRSYNATAITAEV